MFPTRNSGASALIAASAGAMPPSLLGGASPDLGSSLAEIRRLVGSGKIDNFSTIFPLFFCLNGDPLTMAGHQPLEAFCSLEQPYEITLRGARQIGKSQVLSAMAALMGIISDRPPLRITFVCPLQSQVDKLSKLTMKPFIDTSPVKALFVNKDCDTSVRRRTYPNGALNEFTYAGLSMDRIRGSTAHVLNLDECQDFDPDLVSPIERITDATRIQGFGWKRYSGTSKTTATVLEQKWVESSMGEWFVQCQHCKGMGPSRNHGWNIPSSDYHIMKMIGPAHDGIGPEEKGGVAGLVCAWCQKPLMPGRFRRPGEEFVRGYHGFGSWVHRRNGVDSSGRYDKQEDLSWQHLGLHIPQVIIKMHYANYRNWSTLVQEMKTSAPNLFQNEILGEACDTGASLFTKKDLMTACDLGHNNFDRAAIEKVLKTSAPEHRILCVDWGGGSYLGEDRARSFTKVALLVVREKDDGIHVEVPWGCALSNPHAHKEEAEEVYKLFKGFRCQYLAHDVNGSGAVRLSMLRMLGLTDMRRIISVKYAPSHTKAAFKVVPATSEQPLDVLDVNKTTIFQLVAAAIRARKVHFFNFDYEGVDRPGLISDFLNVYPEMRKSDAGPETQVIVRKAGTSDDFAHAVTIGCAAAWHIKGHFPRLGIRH